MGENVNLSPLGVVDNSSFVTELNEKLDTLADEFDGVVYKDGSEEMTGDLNMDSNRIYNLPAPLLDHEPARLADLEGVIADIGDGTGNIGTPYTARAFGNLGLAEDFGFVTPQMFMGTGISHGQAIQDALDYTYSQRQTGGFGYTQGSLGLFIPSFEYDPITFALEVQHPLRIHGEFGGGAGGGGTVLPFTGDHSGFILHGYGTTGETGIGSPQTTYSSGGIMEGLLLKGDFSGTESDAHGINLRAAWTIRDCYIEGFRGEGIYSFTDGASQAGASNCSRLDNIFIYGCRNGVFLDGIDSNAITGIGLSVIANRGWGILDSSFLGNYFFGCHSRGNGDGGAAFPSRCSSGTHRYYVARGQEVWCKTNAPSGTTASNQGWLYFGEGGADASWPAWSNGTEYRSGGSYCSDNVNSSSHFKACYSEQDETPPQLSARSKIDGFIPEAPVELGGNPHGGYSYADSTEMVFGNAVRATSLFCGKYLTQTGIDPIYSIDTSNAYTTISYKVDGVQQATTFFYDGNSSLYNTIVHPAGTFKWQINDNNIIDVRPTGINLYAGMVIKVNGTQVLGAQEAAVANLTSTATAGTLPTPDGSITIADAATPTAVELLEYCVELEAKIETLLTKLRNHGIIAT